MIYTRSEMLLLCLNVQSSGIGGVNVADAEVTLLEVYFQIRAVTF